MHDFIFSNDFSQNIDAMVYTCGYENCVPGHSYGPALRSGYLIHLVLEGKGMFKTNDKVYRLSAGEAFLITPGSLIYYKADDHEPWTYTWIGFQGIKIKPYLSRTSLLEHPVFNHTVDEGFLRCHEKMYEAYQLSENRDLIMNSILYQYLFLLAQKFPNNSNSPEIKRIEYVEEALKYIETNYFWEITVQSIADFLNIDRSYLHRLFKSSVGVSIKEYLLNFRIKRACDLLIHTDLPISTISRSVGYEDSLYFSRLFKNKKSVSPKEYRETHSNNFMENK